MPRLRSIIALPLVIATAMSLTPVASAADTSAEAEAMVLSPARAGRVVNDTSASGGKVMLMQSKSVLSMRGTLPASTEVVVVARGQSCFGSPTMSILVDGNPVHSTTVKSGAYAPYSVTTAIPPGAHTVEISFTNDYNFIFLCDRALFIDKVSVAAGTTEPPVGGTCTDPPPTSTQPFVEDFEGAAGTPPDPQMWDHQLGRGYLEINTNYPRNASLDGNGNLAINALKERIHVPWYGWFDYTSARLHTLGKWEMCYGTLRARIKLPNGKGMRPAFFMLGSDILNSGWPAAGEIDLIDVADRLAGSGIHGTGFRMATEAPFDVTGEFHEFWMKWERDKIVTGVDNHEIATYTPASLPQGASWPFNDHPMVMILNASVGGASQGGPPDATTQFPATMLVDWVRYTPAG